MRRMTENVQKDVKRLEILVNLRKSFLFKNLTFIVIAVSVPETTLLNYFHYIIKVIEKILYS